MYNRTFFGTKLGTAALASIAAMTAMIALSTQITLGVEEGDLAETSDRPSLIVELA